MQNPLLTGNYFIDFANLKVEHMQTAIEHYISAAEQVLQQCGSESHPSWDSIVERLDGACDQLARAWNVIEHLSSTMDSPAIRQCINTCLPKITQFYTRLGLSKPLYMQFCQLQKKATPQLTARQQRVINLAVRDFRLSGVMLEGEKARHYSVLEENLAATKQRFAENVQDATDQFAYVVDISALSDLPADVLTPCEAAARSDGQEGKAKLTLQAPVYLPVMKFVRDESIRAKLHFAFSTRCSELGDPAKSNVENLNEILRLKQEKAQMLGFQNYAEYSLTNKMAEKPEVAIQFLRDLAHKIKPFARKEYADLKNFASTKLNLPVLKPHDFRFASERMREHLFQYSENEVRCYFPSEHVVSALFEQVRTLFSVRLEKLQNTQPLWCDDAELFAVIDERNGATRELGFLAIDLYARTGKRPGAWMNAAIARWKKNQGDLQKPFAYFVCNFPQPQTSTPSLLTLDDVETLFHEFGHALHHLLTEVDELAISGINKVEWDAVELPSQFMENFCWNYAVIKNLSSHFQSGETLPETLYNKLLQAKNFQIALQTLRQIEFALFDLYLHLEKATQTEQVSAILHQVFTEVSVLPHADYERFHCSFLHIFAGAYDAGYYSYLWAELLSCDAFSLFTQTDTVVNSQLGARFRKEILAQGASRSALDSFIAFQKRNPSINAFLEQRGMG